MRKIFLLVLIIPIAFNAFGQIVNDNPENAIELEPQLIPEYQEYTLDDAGVTEINLPSCARGSYVNDIWFKVNVPEGESIDILTQSETLNSAGIEVFSGLPEESNPIACAIEHSRMPKLTNIQGTLIYFRVYATNENQIGNFKIAVKIHTPIPNMFNISIDSNTYTPEELVVEKLITGCLIAENVVYTGHEDAIGFFQNGIPGLEFAEGVILSSGNVSHASGPNSSSSTGTEFSGPGDADLDNISGSSTLDAAVLEFDFMPSSNSLEFEYIFASEEYPEFANSNFNDAFAFLLSGGPENYNNENIALIPGTTTEVSINSINQINNDEYFYDVVNDDYPDIEANIEYDGLTKTLTAIADVTACEMYHIKLVIADCGDGVYDSAVFLKAGSFSSGGNVAMNNYSGYGQDNEIYEGCTNTLELFRIDTTDLSQPVAIDFAISGTATVGTGTADDDITDIFTNLEIPAGQTSITVDYSAYVDNQLEGAGTEYVVFSLVNGCPCNTTTSADTIFIIDNFPLIPDITSDTTICQGENITIESIVDPNFLPGSLDYIWSTGDTTENITVTPGSTQTYSVTINDQCTQIDSVSMTVTVVPTIDPTFVSSEDSICLPEHVIISFQGYADNPATYTYDFDGATIVSGINEGPYEIYWDTPGLKNITLNINDRGCIATSNINVDVNPMPEISLTTNDVLCSGGNTGNATATPLGPNTPYSYIWNNSGASTTDVANNLTAGSYNVTFTNHSGCKETESFTINEPTQMTMSYSKVDVSCFGGHDGGIYLSVDEGTPPYNYSWSSGLPGTENQNNLSAGTYEFTVTDANGCEIINDVEIIQPNEPLSAIQSHTNINCYNDHNGTAKVVPTGGTPPYQYNWNDPVYQTNNEATNLDAGDYTVTIVDVNGCTGIYDFTITQPNELITDIVDSTEVTCNGGHDGSATVEARGGVPNYTYSWSNGSTTEHVDNLEAKNYTVHITDANGCAKFETVKIIEPGPITVSAGNDKWLCIDSTASLNADVTGGTAPFTYTWTGDDGSTYPNYTGASIQPESTTEYTVQVIDSEGCIGANTDKQTLHVYPPLSLNVYPIDTNVCPGDKARIKAEVSGGNGGMYELLLDGIDIIQPNFSIYPEEDGTYTVTLNDNCSPTVSSSFSVYVYDMPENIPTPNTYEACVPATIYFNEEGPIEQNSYYWQFGDGFISERKNTSHIYEESGTYIASLKVTSKHGCEVTKTLSPIIVNPRPEARFDPYPKVVSIVSPEIHFDNYTTGANYYFWDFGTGDTSNLYSPSYAFRRVGAYKVKLTANNEFGCTDTLTQQITIEDEHTFYAPTAFTPNEEVPNDYFRVYIAPEPQEFKMIIYDRWGEEIFVSNNYNEVWYGRVKDGEKAPVGTYTWIVRYKDQIGRGYEKTGHITIVN